MSLVRADHLNQWASTNTARDNLGELLRRLIHSGIPMPALRTIRFLAHETNQLSGWDGLLDCDSEVNWIPNGISVWELGTGGNPRGKIRQDFNNRRDKELPADWNRETTTYVAVTLRKFNNLTELENELKQNSPWQDVKVIDAQTLEEWIERFPNVEAWLQEQNVGPPPSFHTLEREWLLWSEKTQPSVSMNLVIVDREKDAFNFRSALKTQNSVIKVQADSPDEALSFVFAAINEWEPEFREHFLDRSIVIRNKNDTDRMRNSTPHCIILCPPITEQAQMLTSFGHKVINAFGNSSLSSNIDFRLKRPLRYSFSAELENMGMNKEKADIESRACGASPSIWRVWNLLQNADLCSDIPNWASQEHTDIVIPAILLGGWSERFEGDKEVIKNISGYNLGEYQDKLHPFLSNDNPLLLKIDDAWVITAPATAFALVIQNITTSHLEKLSEIAKSVFAEIDPTIDLLPDERPYASFRTEGMRHSTWLRDGLAETLLRIVVIGEHLEETGIIPRNQNRESFVNKLIRDLPGLSEDHRLLTSLRDQLPVLAEAAPFPFLEALESLLQGQHEKILPIFDEGEGVFGHTFHPNFLWALESLAWEPNYLARVGLVLARLAKIDPGGKLANRPIKSLKEIFLAWKPGTSANLEQRLQVLELILEQEPEIGWELINDLMPKSHEFSSPTNEPIWRDFGRSQKEPLTRAGVGEAYQQYIDRAFKFADSMPSRWKVLIGIYPDVSDSHQEAIEKGLQELSNIQLKQEDRKDIWNTLRKLTNRHREYPDASWVLPENQLDRLGELTELFKPVDYLDQVSWLFNDHFPEIPFPRDNLDEVKLEIEKLRKEAIEKVLREGGMNNLVTLVDNVAYPTFVSVTLIDLLHDETETLSVFEKTNQGSDNQRAFAKFLSVLAFNRFGDTWTDIIITRSSDQNWTANAIVNAIENYPDSIKTFELVSSLGLDVERNYWEKRYGWVNVKNNTVFKESVKKLLWAGRALDVVTLITQKLSEIDSKKILEIIDQALKELNEGKTSQMTGGDVGYRIEELFDCLRGRKDIDKSELARREYAYLPLLTRLYDKRDLALHDLLATDPNFFVEVICHLYKPSFGDQEDDLSSEEQKLRAEYAWTLLHSWHRPPGIEENNQVNGKKLREWVVNARHLASKNNRTVVADQHIGNVLFYYPDDPTDSAWPHIELRKLLEYLQCEEIEKGIEIEQYNSRGIVSKEVNEGGVQERELAKKWRKWADSIDLRWTRTRDMLERIASSWDHQAQQEDLREEKYRLRFR